jgi:hypothetical protein
MTDETKPIEVSRRIEAPPDYIFEVLSNPQRHVEFDGSDMLRGPVFDRPILSVGDVFAMKMYFDRLGGNYLMLNHVVEYEPDQRIFWKPAPGDSASAGGRPSAVGQPAGHQWGYVLTPDGIDATVVTETYDCSAAPAAVREAVQNGEQWAPAMEKSLALLDAICTQK